MCSYAAAHVLNAKEPAARCLVRDLVRGRECAGNLKQTLVTEREGDNSFWREVSMRSFPHPELQIF